MPDPYPTWLYPASWLLALLASSLILVYMHRRTDDLGCPLIASLL